MFRPAPLAPWPLMSSSCGLGSLAADRRSKVSWRWRLQRLLCSCSLQQTPQQMSQAGLAPNTIFSKNATCQIEEIELPISSKHRLCHAVSTFPETFTKLTPQGAMDTFVSPNQRLTNSPKTHPGKPPATAAVQRRALAGSPPIGHGGHRTLKLLTHLAMH